MSEERNESRERQASAEHLTEPSAEHLIVQTAFLGDVLLGIPLFKALRNRDPNHKLTLICRKGVGSFFIEAGIVDEVIEIDKKSKMSWADARGKLRVRRFDLVLCPHESFRSALFVSKLVARKKIGFRRFFNFSIFDIRIRRPLEAPEALRQLSLLAAVDPVWLKIIDASILNQAADGGQSAEGRLEPVPRDANMLIERIKTLTVPEILEPIVDSREPIIVLAPGSVWKTKMWTKSGYIEAGKELSKARGALTVVMGSKDELKLCDDIAAGIPNSVSLAGRTSLMESAQLLAKADLLVCNDSGAMHLGATVGVPTVTVFGPTVLEFGYRPWSDNARVVQIPLPCRPCGKHGAQRCPIGTHACMRDIPYSRVVAAANSLSLENNRER